MEYNNSQSKNQINFDKPFFSNGLSEYVVLRAYDAISKDELNFLAQNINWDGVIDTDITGKIGLIQKLDWVKFINKMQVLRLCVRDIENYELYPIDLYEYEADEIIRSVKIYPFIIDKIKIKKDSLKPHHIIDISKIHPEIIERIDFDTIVDEEESLEIAKLGIESAFSKLKFDFKLLKETDKHKVLKSQSYSEESLYRVGAFDEEFDNSFYIRDVVINTGERYINKLQTKYLSSYDWVLILKLQPNLKPYIKLEDFFRGDMFYFVELCILFSEFLELLNKENCKKISSYGWEKILIKFNDNQKVIDLCNFEELEDRTWNILKDKRPELLVYKT